MGKGITPEDPREGGGLGQGRVSPGGRQVREVNVQVKYDGAWSRRVGRQEYCLVGLLR